MFKTRDRSILEEAVECGLRHGIGRFLKHREGEGADWLAERDEELLVELDIELWHYVDSAFIIEDGDEPHD